MAIASVNEKANFNYVQILDEKGREIGRAPLLKGDTVVKFTSSAVVIKRKTSWVDVYDEKGHQIAKGGDDLIKKY